MSNEATEPQDSEVLEPDELAESILRGESAFLDEAEIEIEESVLPGAVARVRIRGADNLSSVVVDLVREDTERLRDELTETLAAE